MKLSKSFVYTTLKILNTQNKSNRKSKDLYSENYKILIRKFKTVQVERYNMLMDWKN